MFEVEIMPENILIGFATFDGISEEGDQVMIFSFGLLFIQFNYIIEK